MCKDPVSHSGGQACPRCGYSPTAKHGITPPMPTPYHTFGWTYHQYPETWNIRWGGNTAGTAKVETSWAGE